MVVERDKRKALWFELAAMMALFYLPSIWAGFIEYLYPWSTVRQTNFLIDVTRLVHYVSIVVPILFIMWRSGEGLAKFGIRRVVWWQALTIILLALFLRILCSYGVSYFTYQVLPSDYFESKRIARVNVAVVPTDWFSRGSKIFLYALGAFAEELIMRGYLITRLKELFGRTWVALLVSAILFASYHIYEGPMWIVLIFFSGMIYGGCFLVTRSVWPSTITHALSNILQLFVKLSY